jgi:hypothetical protein
VKSYLLLCAYAVAIGYSLLQLVWLHAETWSSSVIWIFLFAVLSADEVQDVRARHAQASTSEGASR